MAISKRKATVLSYDPAGIPPVGEFICLPVFIGTNGGLREAKHLNALAF
jgi:hypothetical protein